MENDESKFKVISFPKVEEKKDEILELHKELLKDNEERFNRAVETTDKDQIESFLFVYTKPDGNMFLSSSAIHPKDILFMLEVCKEHTMKTSF